MQDLLQRHLPPFSFLLLSLHFRLVKVVVLFLLIFVLV